MYWKYKIWHDFHLLLLLPNIPTRCQYRVKLQRSDSAGGSQELQNFSVFIIHMHKALNMSSFVHLVSFFTPIFCQFVSIQSLFVLFYNAWPTVLISLCLSVRSALLIVLGWTGSQCYNPATMHSQTHSDTHKESWSHPPSRTFLCP